MKKRAGKILVIVWMLGLCPAAGRAAGIVAKGFKAGMTMSTMTGGDVYDQKFTTGLSAGLFLTWGLGWNFALQPELLVVMKGSRYEDPSLGGALREKLDLVYLELPLLVKMSVLVNESLQAYILAGPSPGLKLSARIRLEIEGRSEEESVESMKALDLGLAVGAGVDFPALSGRLSLEGRFTLSTNTLSKESGNDIRNGAAYLLLGYAF